MKFFNKTSINSAILEPALVAAGRAVGAKTAGVIVKVTQSRHRRVSGMAHSADFCYVWHLGNRLPLAAEAVKQQTTPSNDPHRWRMVSNYYS
jgi:hypothetical protein